MDNRLPSIRIATADDANRISTIYLDSRRMHLPYAPLAHTDEEIRSWIATHIVPSGNTYVILVAGEVQGFIATSRDGSYGWIDHIYLDCSTVGQGLGSLLVEQAKVSLGAPIRLYTFQANVGARRFYQRHGFREIGYTDGATNEERTPDVLMEWS